MSILLISLGTSPAIVPEAFLLPDTTFDEVHVLTTASNDARNLSFVQGWFAKYATGTRLTITRVADFKDFESEADHYQFEEVLLRWWLAKAKGRAVHACLSGGFKTMSAAVQRAASIFGAVDVFHVLADSVYPGTSDISRLVPASTEEQIEDSNAKGYLHWIRLGGESGWPQLSTAVESDYPLNLTREDAGIELASAPNHELRNHLKQLLDRSQNIASAWEQLGELPFSILATWSKSALNWLKAPLDPVMDAAWIKALPKVELHCHLGGFATHDEALRNVRSKVQFHENLPILNQPSLPEAWPLPPLPISLQAYMKLGDANGSQLLKDRGCLRAQCQALYDHFRSQKLVYAEVRCSPANYVSSGRSPWDVVSDIRSAFNQAMSENPGCHVNLILIATRREKGDFRTGISRHLALAVTAAEHWTQEDQCRVVGVDLAGYEDPTTRAHYFREEFTAIHRCGLALTVHAGENDDAEGIWSAVFNLNARRLGHALHLIDSPELLRSVADRGVAVEMCPYANYQIKGYAPMEGRSVYPLKAYLDAGVKVTVNTDNIGISQASLTDNFLLAAKLCQLTRLDVLKLLSNSISSVFESPKLRGSLRARVEQQLPLPQTSLS